MEEKPETEEFDVGNRATTSSETRHGAVPFQHDVHPFPSTPYAYEALFLASPACYTLEDLLDPSVDEDEGGIRSSEEEGGGRWLPPSPSRMTRSSLSPPSTSISQGQSFSSSSSSQQQQQQQQRMVSLPSIINKRARRGDGTGWEVQARTAPGHVLGISYDEQGLLYVYAKFPSGTSRRGLERRRRMSLLEKEDLPQRLKVSLHSQKSKEMIDFEGIQARMNQEAERIARDRRKVIEEIEAARFKYEGEYNPTLQFKVPQRLTKHRLSEFREVLYKMRTVKKMVVGFSHLRATFQIPPPLPPYSASLLSASATEGIEAGGGGIGGGSKRKRTSSSSGSTRELECLQNLSRYSNYTITAKDLYTALTSNQIGLSEEEATVVLENVVEAQAVLQRDQHRRESASISEREGQKEAQLGPLRENIKAKREELKQEIESAFTVVQDHEDLSIVSMEEKAAVESMIQSSYQYMEPEMRAKIEDKLQSTGNKTRVLMDVKETLSKCIMEGGVNNGLEGLSPEALVRIVQNMLAVKLQSAFRCHARFRKYTGAMKLNRKLLEEFKGVVFKEMKEAIQLSITIRSDCRRVFHRWTKWCIKRKVLHHHFQQAFWPFHIWWRYTIKRMRARDKSRFLVAVYRMYMKKRCFNALHRFSQLLKQRKAMVRPFLLAKGAKNNQFYAEILRCWRVYTRQRGKLKKAWITRGKYRREAVDLRLMQDCFVAWRYTSHLRSAIKRRASQYFREGYMDFMAYQRAKQEENLQSQDQAAAAEARRRRSAGATPSRQFGCNEEDAKRREEGEEEGEEKEEEEGNSDRKDMQHDLLTPPFSHQDKKGSDGKAVKKQQDLLDQPLSNLSLPGTAWNFQRQQQSPLSCSPTMTRSASLPTILPSSSSSIAAANAWQQQRSPSTSRMPLFPYVHETNGWPPPCVAITTTTRPKQSGEGDPYGSLTIREGGGGTPLQSDGTKQARERGRQEASSASPSCPSTSSQPPPPIARRLQHWIDLCRPTYLHYVHKDRRAVMVAHLRFVRLAPLAMFLLQEWVIRRKKSRQAKMHANQVLEAKVIMEWKEITIILRKEKNRQALMSRYEGMNMTMSYMTSTLSSTGHSTTMRPRKHWLEKAINIEGLELTEMEKDMITRQREELLADDIQAWLMTLVRQQEEGNGVVKQKVEESRHKRSVFRMGCFDLIHRENNRGVKADDAMLEYSKDFTLKAVKRLVYSLVRANASIQTYYSIHQVKHAFRHLRLLYIEGKIRHMYNYFRLRRHLQICHRIQYLMEGMPIYRTLRTKWVLLNRWFAYMDMLYARRTPGLSQKFKRRRQLYNGFSNVLRQDELLIHTHYHPTFLLPILTSFKNKCVYQRWVSYTQQRIAYRLLKQKTSALATRRFLRRAFWSWRTDGAGPDRTFHQRQKISPMFTEKRLMADIGVVRSWVVASDRRGLARAIKEANGRWARKVAEKARQTPSFRKAMVLYGAQLEERFLLERSLLFDAIQDRGRMEFVDRESSGVIGKPKAAGAGVVFSSLNLPESFLLNTIGIHFKQGRGIVGLSLNATPGELSDDQIRVLPGLGHTSGNASYDSFTIKNNERVVGVDAMVSIVIEQIRFKTNRGRVSAWLGRPVNQSFAVLQSLYVDDPTTEYVVGFYGSNDKIRLSNLGLKIRRVTKENLFTYHWVENKAPRQTILDDENEATRTATPTSSSSPFASTTSAAASMVGGAESPEQVSLILLAMRNVDLKEAKSKALAFVMRLWEEKGISKKYRPLCQPLVALGMMKWFFQSSCHELPPYAYGKALTELLAARVDQEKHEGMKAIAKAKKIKAQLSRAQAEGKQPPKTDLLDPTERATELQRQSDLQNFKKQAEALEKEAKEHVSKSQALIEESRSLLPRLSLSHSNRAYYRRLLHLIRTQAKLQMKQKKENGGGGSARYGGKKAGGGGSGGTADEEETISMFNSIFQGALQNRDTTAAKRNSMTMSASTPANATGKSTTNANGSSSGIGKKRGGEGPSR